MGAVLSSHSGMWLIANFPSSRPQENGSPSLTIPILRLAPLTYPGVKTAAKLLGIHLIAIQNHDYEMTEEGIRYAVQNEKTVSYTHLDVYKRQALPSTVHKATGVQGRSGGIWASQLNLIPPFLACSP